MNQRAPRPMVVPLFFGLCAALYMEPCGPVCARALRGLSVRPSRFALRVAWWAQVCPGQWRARLSALSGRALRGAFWANVRPGPWWALRSASCAALRVRPSGVYRWSSAPHSAAGVAAQPLAAIRRALSTMAVENLRDFLRDAGVPPNCPDPRAWVEDIAVICEKYDVWHAQVARAGVSAVSFGSPRTPLRMSREALVILDASKMNELSPGKQHFLQGAVRLALKKWEPSGAGRGHADQATTGGETLAALTAALKGPNEPNEHVDIGAKLAGLNLAGLPPRAWPRTAKTDALATEIAKMKKRGYTDPFVYTDLRTWLPQGAALRGGDAGKWREREFGWPEWHLAFDQYMVAGAATAQLSLGAALAHKQNVLQVRAFPPLPWLTWGPPRRLPLGVRLPVASGRWLSMHMCRGVARNWGSSMTKSVGPRPILSFGARDGAGRPAFVAAAIGLNYRRQESPVSPSRPPPLSWTQLS